MTNKPDDERIQNSGFLTFREASAQLNLPYHVIQRAAKKGAIPTYRLVSARKYVRLADIYAAMRAE